MSINLSNLIGTGGGGSSSSVFDFHALSRTTDGMLVYTLEDASSNNNIQVFNHPVGDLFYTLDDYVEASPAGRDRNYIFSSDQVDNVGDLNDANDKYQQYRFETRKVRYFIDNDGYLVARLNNNYTYTGPK